MGTMREDFDAVIDDLDVADTLGETEQVVEPTDDDTSVTSAFDAEETVAEVTESDDDKKEVAAEDKNLTSAVDAEAAASDPSKDTPEPDTSKDSLKAPVGWSPKEREQWSKVPREIQQRINNREREMAESMAGTKEARQAYEQINKITQSFGPVLAADGFSSPTEAMQAAFGSMAAMRMGTPQQKATEVARIVKQYGIDINALDDALVGNVSPQGAADPQSAAIERIIEQRMAPMTQFMQTIEQAQQAKIGEGRQQANSAVMEFSKTAEFLPDVREDMADIIDLAAKRGVNLSMQQAYDRACAAHPEIANVMSERKRAEAITGGQQVLASKRNAASSISGRKTGQGGGGSALSMRDSIAAAFDEAAS